MTLNISHGTKDIYADDCEKFDEDIINKKLNDFIVKQEKLYPTKSFGDIFMRHTPQKYLMTITKNNVKNLVMVHLCYDGPGKGHYEIHEDLNY